jgi:hypothetical protein
MKYTLHIVILIFISTLSYKLGQKSTELTHPPINKINLLKECTPAQTNYAKVTPKKKQVHNKKKIIALLDSVSFIPSSLVGTHKMIQQASEDLIEEKMISEFGEIGTQSIGGKKKFLKNLANIYFEDNTSVDSNIVGQTRSFVSNSTNIEDDEIEEIELNHQNAKQKLYVHLEVDNDSMDNTGQVLVKWENISTGKTLLFTRKAINESNAQNWVSFVPDDGWRKGEYEVKFFNFSDALLPLSQAKYVIY